MRSYRDIEMAPIETAAILREAAEAALALLAREGTRGASEEPERAGHSVWRLQRMSPTASGSRSRASARICPRPSLTR